ncbi:uncharacterized protein LOC108024087 [Drosophila biarmipes]|uniref:uncharacterized protein LOC108024087 n=1 Tax=Drosophila biarmipes TaxID=125945 RepID=UPI0007E75ECB|nr:uncharacterized protein LOC108024087 [Drosophila biarmipes]
MPGGQPDEPRGSPAVPEPVFIVEKIIGKRIANSRLQFLVKWEGFPKTSNSWEPIEHVSHCCDLIGNFEKELVRQGLARELATSNEPVAKILDKRLVDGCVQYLVKWRSYPQEDNSWEPLEALSHCLDLLGDFEAQLMARSQAQEAQFVAQSQAQEAPFIPPSQGQEATSSAGSSQWPSGRSKRMRSLSKDPLVGQQAASNTLAVTKRRRRGPLPRREACIVLLDESSDLGAPEAAVASQSEAAPSAVINPPVVIKRRRRRLPRRKASIALLHESSHRVTPEAALTSQSAAAPPAQETNEPSISEQPPSDVLAMEPVGAGAPSASNMPSPDTEQEELPSCSSVSNPAPHSWKMPPCKSTFGLMRGLELDKVCHSFAVREHLFLFVTWKGCPKVDAVPLADLAKVYPIEVLRYFQSLEKLP